MRQFYLIPSALLAASPPNASWHAHPAPGSPGVTMLRVDSWADHLSQDAWEALPGVLELHAEALGLTAPPAVISALAPWGAVTGMTLRQVFQEARQNWSLLRH